MTQEHDKKTESKTVIRFDLADVLTPEELASFEREAEKAHASSLTDHFLNITLRPAANPQEAA